MLSFLTSHRLPLHRVGFNKEQSVQSDAKVRERQSELGTFGARCEDRLGEMKLERNSFNSCFLLIFVPTKQKSTASTPIIFVYRVQIYCTVVHCMYFLRTSIWDVKVSAVPNRTKSNPRYCSNRKDATLQTSKRVTPPALLLWLLTFTAEGSDYWACEAVSRCRWSGRYCRVVLSDNTY